VVWETHKYYVPPGPMRHALTPLEFPYKNWDLVDFSLSFRTILNFNIVYFQKKFITIMIGCENLHAQILMSDIGQHLLIYYSNM
jgi:hypothetical protein